MAIRALLLIFVICKFELVLPCVDNEPVPNNCQNYYHCTKDNITIEFQCIPPNNYFNCITKTCQNTVIASCCQEDPSLMQLRQGDWMDDTNDWIPIDSSDINDEETATNMEMETITIDNGPQITNIDMEMTGKTTGNQETTTQIEEVQNGTETTTGRDDTNESIPFDSSNVNNEETTNNMEMETKTIDNGPQITKIDMGMSGKATGNEDTTTEIEEVQNGTETTTFTSTGLENVNNQTEELQSSNHSTEITETTTSSMENSSEASSSIEITASFNSTSHSPDIIDNLENFFRQIAKNVVAITDVVNSMKDVVNIITNLLGFKEVDDKEDTTTTTLLESTTIPSIQSTTEDLIGNLTMEYSSNDASTEVSMAKTSLDGVTNKDLSVEFGNWHNGEHTSDNNSYVDTTELAANFSDDHTIGSMKSIYPTRIQITVNNASNFYFVVN